MVLKLTPSNKRTRLQIPSSILFLAVSSIMMGSNLIVGFNLSPPSSILTLNQNGRTSTSSYHVAGKKCSTSLFSNSNCNTSTYRVTKTHPKQYNDNDNKDKDSNEEQDNVNLDLAGFRLDGLEIYVLVSVISTSSSYDAMVDSIYNNNNGHQLPILEYLQSSFSFISITTGLYATVIFSLCVLYAKTSLGMGKNKSYNAFMQQTAKQRNKAFTAFSLSLLFFVFQSILLVTQKFPADFQIIATITLIATAYMIGIQDCVDVIEIAGKLLFPPPEEEFAFSTTDEVETEKVSSLLFKNSDETTTTTKEGKVSPSLTYLINEENVKQQIMSMQQSLDD